MNVLLKSSKIYLQMVNLFTTYPVLYHIMLGIILTITLNNCASTSITGEKEVHYPLIDTRLKVHKYKENIQWMIFPKHNTKLTQYCSVHFEWEDITPIYRKINEEMKWVYRVNKNKKSFK